MRFVKSVGENMIISFDFSNDNVSSLFGIGTENDYLEIFFHGNQKSIHIWTIF